MKDYNQVFTCELPVQQLAEQLFKVIHRESHEAEDNEYYMKVVESIVDSIADNGAACANVFNALNGWEKKETPIDREIQGSYRVDDAVSFKFNENCIENNFITPLRLPFEGKFKG